MWVSASLPVEEGVSERVELPEGFFGVDHQSVAGDDALIVAVHHRDEAVGGRLWTDPHPRKILLQQVPGLREGERESVSPFTHYLTLGPLRNM